MHTRECVIPPLVIPCSLLHVVFYVNSYGFVDFASVEEAKVVFDRQEEIEVDGRVLFINFASSPPRKCKSRIE